MFKYTTLLLLLGTASALPAQQAPQAQVVHHPTMGDGGDGPAGGGETGDGPCYDAAKKTLDDCLKVATGGGSSAAGQMCRLTYAAQVAACDAQMGE